MKKLKIFKLISIASYLFIIMMGQMIGLPFIFWLAFTLFDFGNIDQLFSLLAIIGLIISLMTFNWIRTYKIMLLDIVCFLLLVSPLVQRVMVVRVGFFNYLAFIIPTAIFCLCYIVSVYYSVKLFSQNRKS
jgi:hypothetical protein